MEIRFVLAQLLNDTNNEAVSSTIFVHSSFRTGSTWLWSKFRRNPRFYAYYEFLNEALANLNFATINHCDRDWRSHHPVEAPYFLEFAPLLNELGNGVRGYDPNMAFANFFLTEAGDDSRLIAQRDYVALLIGTARQAGRLPVLTCTRTLARVGWLKQTFGGLHLSLRRGLLHQWFSYSNQAANGNPYFIGTVISTILADTDDPLIIMLRRFVQDNNMDVVAEGIHPPDDNLFICFFVLHIYLDFIAARDADLVVNLADIAAGLGEAREELASAVHQHSGVDLDFSDVREIVSAPMMLFGDRLRIDLTVRSIFMMLRQTGAGNKDTAVSLVDFASRQMDALWEGYDRYCYFSGSAHAEISRLRLPTINPSDSVGDERDTGPADLADVLALEGECRRLKGERDAALGRCKEAEAKVQQERVALTAALDDAVAKAATVGAICEAAEAHRDAARAELVDVLTRTTALEDECRRLECERDAALERCKEAEANVQQERLAMTAALDDAIAKATTAGAICEAAIAERDAAHADLVDAAVRTTALEDEREALETARMDAVANIATISADRATEKSERDAEKARQEVIEYQLMAMTNDANAFRAKHDDLEGALANAHLEIARQRKEMASAIERHVMFAEHQTTILSAAQRHISELEKAIDAQIFKNPSDADAFAHRWTKMITNLR